MHRLIPSAALPGNIAAGLRLVALDYDFDETAVIRGRNGQELGLPQFR